MRPAVATSKRLRAASTYLLPAILTVAFFLPGINQGALRTDSDLYGAIGLQAWNTGRLFPLMTGDQPYLNKPPLAFWIHGASMHLLGPSLLSARLPTLLAALGAVLCTVHAVRAASGRRAALLAGLVLAATPEFFRHMHAVSLDMWLTFFFSAALALAVTASRRRAAGAPNAALWTIAIGIPIGLSLLVKPLVGFLPLGILSAWLLLSGPRRAATLVWLLAAAIIAIAIALPWHLAMHARFGDAFLARYIGDQVVDRATGAAHNPSPWFNYARTLTRTYWPWLPLAVIAMVHAGRSLAGRSSPRARALALPLLWTVVWIVCLSAFGDKAGRYLLPVYPALSWLIGAWAASLRPIALRRAIARWAPPVALGACLLAVVLSFLPVTVHKPRSPQWAQLNTFLDAQPADTELWAAPGAVTLGANIYLDRGTWPRTARASDDLQAAVAQARTLAPAGDPPAGALLILRKGSRFGPRPSDQPVFEAGPIIITRVTTPWDGAFTLQRESGDAQSPPASSPRDRSGDQDDSGAR